MRWLRGLPVVLLFWLCFAVYVTLRAADPPASPGLKTARLCLVTSQPLIGTFHKDDATATLSIWIKRRAEIQGFRCDSGVDIRSFIARIRRGIRKRTLDLLVLDTSAYLSLAHEGLVEAAAAGTSRRRQWAAYPYLLLAKDETGAAQVAGLRGKRISVASRTGSNLGLIWLATRLAENKLNRAVNPQLHRLRIVEHSEALLEEWRAMPVQPQHPYKREISKSILHLPRTVASDQRGIVFKASPQVSVTTKDFRSVANRLNRYRSMLKLPVDSLHPIIGRLDDTREID